MKRIALPILIAAAMAFTLGCTTKKEVSREVTPVMNKVDELDERTAQTTHGIHDTDQRAQQGIAGVDAKADAADQKAQAAGQQADQAQQLANTANAGVNDLTNRVVNFDNYHSVTETAVLFGFDKAALTAKDKAELDEIGSQAPTVKNYIVQIEGRTDSVGNADYNYSQPAPRRRRHPVSGLEIRRAAAQDFRHRPGQGSARGAEHLRARPCGEPPRRCPPDDQQPRHTAGRRGWAGSGSAAADAGSDRQSGSVG